MPFPSRMLHPVHVKDGVLSPQECAELIALAKSIAPSGYRDNVTAATMDVVIAANPAFLVPIVPIRGTYFNLNSFRKARNIEP